MKTDGDVQFKRTFSKCKKAESFAGLPQWETSRVVNMVEMFRDCELLHQDDMYELQVHNVTNMTKMFYYAKAFNTDLSSWCVPKLANSNTHKDVFYRSLIQDVPTKHPVWGQCPPRVISQPVIV